MMRIGMIGAFCAASAVAGAAGLALAQPKPLPPIPPTAVSARVTPGSDAAKRIVNLANIKPLAGLQQQQRYKAALSAVFTAAIDSMTLETPLRFSARRMFVDELTYASVLRADVVTKDPSIGNLPDGYILMYQAFPDTPTMDLHFLAAAARAYVVDCAVGGTSGIYVGMQVGSGKIQYVTPVDGHVVFGVPSAAARHEVTVNLYPRSDGPPIQLTSCDVVPVVVLNVPVHFEH